MKLILIYNADTGVFNAVSDSIKKTLSPVDYQCSLCAVTHGLVSMRHEWRKFLGSLPMDKEFIHRDEAAKFGIEGRYDLPALVLEDSDKMQTLLIGSDELNAINDLSELIGLTQQRIAKAHAV
ncbi:MAG: hypothetical protein ABJP70_05640 [Erythrobacter sp.]